MGPVEVCKRELRTPPPGNRKEPYAIHHPVFLKERIVFEAPDSLYGDFDLTGHDVSSTAF